MARILVVEDEARIASFVARALKAEGFDVANASEGISGLELARSGDFDLVVLDLLLPGLDGTDVLQELIEVRPDQRVLVLSALSDVKDRVHCFELGALDYLQKPFAISELIARVRARLRQPAAPTYDRSLRVGGLTLDVISRVADPGTGPVSLSHREFLLLQALMRQHGDVLSRQRLLAEVWGYSFEPGTNVVEVFVRRLRSKLGPDVIETVRGVGYRLAA